VKKKFSAQSLIEMVQEDSDEAGTILRVEGTEETVGKSRWSTEHQCVFREVETVLYFRTPVYRRAATESQEDEWFSGRDEVECTQVEEREVTVKQWLPVKA
jgi:hypothetical protein